MSLSLIVWITLIASIAIFFLQKSTNKNKNKKLPPGPKGLPILGHIHMLGKNPHQDLQKLAQKYGPIMYIKLGCVPTIVVSSPQAAKLFLKAYDLVFANRPPREAVKYLFCDGKDIVFSSYGPYWRNMRRLCTLELLTTAKINSFQPMRREEVSLFLKFLTRAAKDGAPVNLSAEISSLAMKLSCRMLLGKKWEDDDPDAKVLVTAIQEGLKLVATPNLGDYFPYIGMLDLQGHRKRLKAVAKFADYFFDKFFDEHVRRGDDGQNPDIVDTLMSIMASEGNEFQLDRGHAKSILQDLIAASMDTTSGTVEWILSELLKNPHIMKKLQKELEDVVGLNRTVEESDLNKLEYLNLIIKETFRLRPVSPLLVPHYSMEDCKVDGYDIPKEAQVLINVYAIGKDPNIWTDPEKFLPERFLGSEIDLSGKHFELIPFGSGRRACPGIQLGLIQVRLIVSQLVHCFDWKLPDNVLPEDLDMAEEFSQVIARENPLITIPCLRLL